MLAKLYRLEFQYPKNWHYLELGIFETSPGLHRKGLRVVADVVFNHVAWRGWVWLIISNGENGDKP